MGQSFIWLNETGHIAKGSLASNCLYCEFVAANTPLTNA